MRIGYACLAVAVPDARIAGCTLKNANEAHLAALIANNLASLETIIDYNARNGISLFRISSDIIPFGSSEAAKLPWAQLYRETLARIGRKIRVNDMRVSMHPGQYTVLNSPIAAVAVKSIEDLQYHACFLDSLGMDSSHKIVLHIGGAYGDKKRSLQQFLMRYAILDDSVRRRLVLENDDTLFHIADVLETAVKAGLPVVYDNLHNAVNPADKAKDDAFWVGECARTWQKCDGSQKVHYSQQHPEKKPGAHSESIVAEDFLAYYNGIVKESRDIMLEVKDKNISAIKCLLCTQERGIKALEEEWARYKYSVLERCPLAYQQIRALLRDKSGYPARDFYRLAEQALRQPEHIGHSCNALQHVWGYFKDVASDSEKKHFNNQLTAFRSGTATLRELKQKLYRLAVKYRVEYLLNAYYFYIG